MKKAILLLLCGSLALYACHTDPVPEAPSKDSALTGTKVDVAGIPSGIRKIFVLNEGGMGANNATLDFLRVSDGNYITGAFKKMNPAEGAGLGDVGNDIVVIGDEVWIVVNNSGIVEVLSAKDETEIAAITIPTPRNIAFDEHYAYVTSWAGAFAQYTYDDKGGVTLTDFKNPKGQVYRINLETKKIDGQVEVGWQPEGIACYNGRLYVANSGGIACSLPPDYAYDKTVSVIDVKSFKVTKTLEVEINLKSVCSDNAGNIYVTTFGNFATIHSGLYMIDTRNGDAVKKIGDYVSAMTIFGQTVFCIGNENELDWSAPRVYKGWSCTKGVKGTFSLPVNSANLYGIIALDADTFLTGDAGDYFNPGSVTLYHKGSISWTVPSGVCPGHFAIW